MDTLPAGAMALPVPLARGAVAQIRDAPQLLDVQMQQVPDGGMFVARHHGGQLETAAPVQPAPAQDPPRRRRADPQRARDLGARPVLPAQHFDGELQGGRCPCRTVMRSTGPVEEPRRSFGTIPPPPFPRRAHGDLQPPSLALERRPGFQLPHEFLSTAQRESGILMHVHPGLLSRVSNDLAATTFPRSAWVNNLLLLHI